MNTARLLEPAASSFINKLTPVDVLALMGDKKNKIHYSETASYLAGEGFQTRDFYYNRGNYLSWFCYCRDYVVVDIPHFTATALKDYRTVDQIKLETERLHQAIKNKRFKSFFYMVDPRTALLAYQHVFDLLPDQEKFPLFQLVYAKSGCRLMDLPREHIDKLLSFRPVQKITGVDQDGYITIYRGQIPGSTPVQEAASWTLDLNTAIYYATRFNLLGQVFSALVHEQKVVFYIRNRNEKEIVAYPEDIEDIELYVLPGYDDLQPELEEAGVFEVYNHYHSLLKEEYFSHPFGIHGIAHTERVLLLVLILTYLEGADDNTAALLALAALYHDIGRTNDNYDPCHGRESFKKLSQLGLLTDRSDEEREIIRFLITNHSIDDITAIKSIGQYRVGDRDRALTLFNLFKDADGLERIRINDLDIRQLRTASARKLPLLARQILNANQRQSKP